MLIDKGGQTMKPPASLCVVCKGTKHMCGLNYCPLLESLKAKRFIHVKKDVFGPSEMLFAGSYGYPNVSIGPLVSSSNIQNIEKMYSMEYKGIIEYMSSQIRGKRFRHISSKMDDEMTDVALSTKPVDVEMGFSRALNTKIKFSPITQPVIAGAPIKYLREIGNPKIPKFVDSLVEDKVKSTEAIPELFRKGYDNYYITKILSAGTLGKNPHIVPTRWSITAVDDMLAKEMRNKIHDFESINKIYVFSNEKFMNHFEVILLPGTWRFENFETWAPNTTWAMNAIESITTEEYEGYNGRTKYADKQVGGYYASRFAVLEYLYKLRKQATAVVIREVHTGYKYPLGVWEVRENVRHAFANVRKSFSTLKDALEDISTRLNLPVQRYTKVSKIFGQTRIVDWA